VKTPFPDTMYPVLRQVETQITLAADLLDCDHDDIQRIVRQLRKTAAATVRRIETNERRKAAISNRERSDERAQQMLEMRESGMTLNAIGLQFGVSGNNVRDVLRRLRSRRNREQRRLDELTVFRATRTMLESAGEVIHDGVTFGTAGGVVTGKIHGTTIEWSELEGRVVTDTAHLWTQVGQDAARTIRQAYTTIPLGEAGSMPALEIGDA